MARSLSLAQIAHILHREGFFPSLPDNRILHRFKVVKSRGVVFCSLKGAKADGHDFLHEIKGKGAVGAVVSSRFQGNIQGLKLIFVDDPLVALQDIAKTVLAKFLRLALQQLQDR